MKPYQYSNPQPACELKIDKFRGVDFETHASKVDFSRSPDMLNMIADNTLFPEKRLGYKSISSIYDTLEYKFPNVFTNINNAVSISLDKNVMNITVNAVFGMRNNVMRAMSNYDAVPGTVAAYCPCHGLTTGITVDQATPQHGDSLHPQITTLNITRPCTVDGVIAITYADGNNQITKMI